MNTRQFRRGGAILAAVAVGGLSTLAAHATNVVPFACPAGGGSISGDGSSLENNAKQGEISAYAGACPGNGTVTYTSTGSWKGIMDFTAGAVQFAGTTIPYSDAQWAAMHTKSHVETIPFGLAAIDVAVNLTCMSNFQLSGAAIGQIYAGKITNWSQVNAACPSTAITAYHRPGSAGTTTVFKTYLTKKDPADFGAGCALSTCYKDPTTNWPSPGTPCAGANTDQNMATCLTGTIGAIAYIGKPDIGGASGDVVQVDNGASSFMTPQPGQCTTAVQSGATPLSPSADWSQVDVTDGPNGYGICTYMYELFYLLPVTAGVATAAQAVAIQKFAAWEVSDAGQQVLVDNGYDPLPPEVQAAAQVGAAMLTTH